MMTRAQVPTGFKSASDLRRGYETTPPEKQGGVFADSSPTHETYLFSAQARGSVGHASPLCDREISMLSTAQTHPSDEHEEESARTLIDDHCTPRHGFQGKRTPSPTTELISKLGLLTHSAQRTQSGRRIAIENSWDDAQAPRISSVMGHRGGQVDYHTPRDALPLPREGGTNELGSPGRAALGLAALYREVEEKEGAPWRNEEWWRSERKKSLSCVDRAVPVQHAGFEWTSSDEDHYHDDPDHHQHPSHHHDSRRFSAASDRPHKPSSEPRSASESPRVLWPPPSGSMVPSAPPRPGQVGHAAASILPLADTRMGPGNPGSIHLNLKPDTPGRAGPLASAQSRQSEPESGVLIGFSELL